MTLQVFKSLSIAALCGLLIALSWPRLHAAWSYLPVESAIRDFWNEGALEPERLAKMRQRAGAVVSENPHPRYWEGLSLLHYLQGARPDMTLFDQREALESSVQAAEASLRLAPVQPRLWMRTADAMDWLSFYPEPALDALKMSVLTGRVEPMLQLSRLRLGYARVQALDEEGLDLLRDQTVLAWKMRQREVANAIRKGDLQLLRIRFVLSTTHPDVLAEIEDSLAPGT